MSDDVDDVEDDVDDVTTVGCPLESDEMADCTVVTGHDRVLVTLG